MVGQPWPWLDSVEDPRYLLFKNGLTNRYPMARSGVCQLEVVRLWGGGNDFCCPYLKRSKITHRGLAVRYLSSV